MKKNFTYSGPITTVVKVVSISWVGRSEPEVMLDIQGKTYNLRAGDLITLSLPENYGK